MAPSDNAKRKAASINKSKKSLGVAKKPSVVSPKNQKKPKSVSLKNQIRSTERMLKKDLPAEVREAQQKKLEDIKKQVELQIRLAAERKIIIKNKKLKFFERRKVERGIKRLEKVLQTSSDNTQEENIKEQLTKLKEDLEYVKFFPKTEKYVSLFIGGDEADVVERRNRLRKQIKANIEDAVASGKDLEETGDAADALLGTTEDDFFLNGSSSDEADAGAGCADKSSSYAREQAPSFSKKAAPDIVSRKRGSRDYEKPASGISTNQAARESGNAEFDKYTANKNQRQKSTRAVVPPTWSSKNSFRSLNHPQTSQRFEFSSSKKPSIERIPLPASINKSNIKSFSSSRNGHGISNARTENYSNPLTNSDTHKPKRKRRPKKKKQQQT